MNSTLFRHAKVAVAGVSTAVFLSTMSAAQAAGSDTSGQPLYLAYAWLPQASPAQSAAQLSKAQKRQVAARQKYFGSGSYICSPSGFGKKSRCFAR